MDFEEIRVALSSLIKSASLVQQNKICLVSEVASTMDEVKKFLDEKFDPPKQGFAGLVLAASQTAGRGRQGRVWQSPEGSGIYLSVLYRMDAALSSKLGLLPLIVGSNLAKQLADYIPNLRVKWPNDLLVETESGAKKISGLLLEAIHDTDSVSVIIGVGFNLKKREIPGAVSFEEVSTISVSAGEISKLILDSILVSCQNLGSLSIEAFREQYNKQVISLGKVVKFVESSGAEISGINQGINEDGSLAINTGENTLNLYSGDVHQVN